MDAVEETPDEVQVPVWVRATFAHAVVQHLADQVGADVLHLKGAATDVDLRSRPEGGTDADVLVRPSHVSALLEAMWAHGWRRLSTFETGSAFEHATTAEHPDFLFADLHRFNPGFDADPAQAFDVLWQRREVMPVAGVPCARPDRAGRVLVHVLNATRSRQVTWTQSQIDDLLPEGGRAQLEELVDLLRAHVGLGAALGDLDRYRGERSYRMWRFQIEGGTRVQEWLARAAAAPSRREAAVVLLRAPLVNTDRLADQLGRPPTRREIAREFLARPLRGAREELGRWKVAR